MKSAGATMFCCRLVLVGVLASASLSASESEPEPGLLVTKKVTFEIEISGEAVGKFVIGVFGEAAPKTVENFVQLATGENGYGYKGSRFHRAVKDFMIQGGDYVNGNGTGEGSIYGGTFDDETLDIKHYGSGWVSMANRGPNTNTCQFFITLRATPWLDGAHVVFGKVLEGMDVVRLASKVPTNENDKTTVDVVIKDSYVYDVEPFTVPLEGADNEDGFAPKMDPAQGVQMETITEGDGVSFPKRGQTVYIHYDGTLTNGHKFDSSRDKGNLYWFRLEMGDVIKGMDTAVSVMSKGQRCMIRIPSDLAYGARGAGNDIPPNADLVFDVELVDIKWVEVETITAGDGTTFAARGQTISMHYTGTLTDGTQFDSSRDKGVLYKFKHQMGEVIRGMDSAVSQMSLGERATVRIPAELAYGNGGYGDIIPANSDLVFDIELISIQ